MGCGQSAPESTEYQQLKPKPIDSPHDVHVPTEKKDPEPVKEDKQIASRPVSEPKPSRDSSVDNSVTLPPTPKTETDKSATLSPIPQTPKSNSALNDVEKPPALPPISPKSTTQANDDVKEVGLPVLPPISPAPKAETPAPAQTEPSAPQAPEDPTLDEFIQTNLQAHNDYRAKHGCPPLTVSKRLCDKASEWANTLATTNDFKHSDKEWSKVDGKNVGENIYLSEISGTGKSLSDFGDGPSATDAWYSEIKDFTFGADEPDNFHATGHFSQVVWKNTTEFGIGRAIANVDGCCKMIICAQYLPAGNYQGEYKENVPACI